ncbi:MAG TPA: calcium/proton exchanger [Thermomicrobiales bacterium]|nr:calcium/proton exchanger [Thermomicrobiales bacterium]
MKIIYGMLILVPIAFALEFMHAPPTAIFAVSAVALVPLAAILGRATEEVALYTGPKIGALLNATLGNAAELIITIVALRAGLIAIVKASIAGSIIGNILIVLGLSLLLGGLRNGIQVFDAKTAGVNANMMALAVIALSVPAVFALGSEEIRPTPQANQFISDGLAVVLIVLYALYLLYSLRGGEPGGPPEPEHHGAKMKLPTALAILAGSTILIVFMSEFLVGAVEPTAEAWGLSELFIGVMLVPLVGNVAEHIVAVQVAIQNKMDLSLGIAVGSGLQIALFVAPVLVLAGVVLGQPMNLIFNAYELAALVGAAVIASLISVDGESNWLEGALLMLVYLILAISFFEFR